MRDRRARAQVRRRTWEATVVEAGAPKGALYRGMTPEQRLEAFVELNRKAWQAAGIKRPAQVPRSQWPGEILELGRHV